MKPDETPAQILVIGAGNLLMGDEGVGIHVLRALERESWPAQVRLLDGGTGGINLLGELSEARSVVFVDATRDGRPAGTVMHLKPRAVAELPRCLSAHDFGVRDLFAAAAVLGQLPDLHVITISVETLRPMCLELSEPVAAAVPSAALLTWELACRLARSGSGLLEQSVPS